MEKIIENIIDAISIDLLEVVGSVIASIIILIGLVYILYQFAKIIIP